MKLHAIDLWYGAIFGCCLGGILSTSIWLIKDWISKKWLENRQSRVKEELPNHGLCLDVGCGEHPLFPTTINLDVDVRVEPTVCADALSFPFKNSIFNHVYCTEVIEHLENHECFYEEVNRVLRSMGRVALTTPQETPLWRFIWFFWSKTLGRKWNNTHHREFKVEEMANSFKILENSKVNRFLNFVIGEKIG